MKQLFMAIGISALLFSCQNNHSEKEKALAAAQDSMNKQFEDWKAAEAKDKYDADLRAIREEHSHSQAVAVAPAAKPVHRKKWSKAAKGAVIGGVSGAVLGAVVDKKNPAVGAVAGSLLGSGVGYGIGRAGDKKDGR
jgi:uncharacterized protein YcfJ